jgi:hypothetical protein
MTTILQALNDLAQAGWGGLGLIISAIWAKGLVATLAAVAFVLWAWKAS